MYCLGWLSEEQFVAQVGQLGEQLSVLRASYRQLAGLPETPTKVDFHFICVDFLLKALKRYNNQSLAF